MNDSLPYKVLYATGDQSCMKCGKQICAGKVQMAIMMQSDDEDCNYPDWYDQKCFFRTRLPSTEAAFDGFAKLRYDDQIAINKEIVISGDEPIKVIEKAKIPYFGIDYETETVASCVACKRCFRGDKLRIMHFVHDVNQNNGTATWFHLECFIRSRNELGFLESGEMLPGFKRLKDEDKKRVKRRIPPIKEKVKNPMGSNAESVSREVQIKEQNHEYFKLYDQLKEHLSETDQIAILEANEQFLPEDNTELLHHLTDVLYFGALKYCTKCRDGYMVFDNWHYACANATPWAKCDNKVQTPQRKLAKIPIELESAFPFLKPSSVKVRVLHPFRLTDDDGNDLVYAPYKHPTLFNMEFVVIGNLEKPTEEIIKTISKMGGKVVSKIHRKLAAVISNKEEIQRMGSKMVEAKKYDIQVVSVDFLTELHPTDPILYVISESLSNWGGDPYARIEQNDVKSRRETNFYVKSLPEKIPHKLNGVAVDFECGLDENANVYSELVHFGRKVHYSVTLGLVDIENNKNSYHRMQLLQSKEIQLFWVFESWGRISTCIGSKRLHTFGKLEEARDKFRTVYKKKTGNVFGTQHFVKQPNQFYHLDINIDVPVKVPENVVETKLNKTVYHLMQLMFDLKKMEDMMISCDLDLKQMPLGKISSKQISEAMKILNNISKLIGKNGSRANLIEASNRFYTLIPHSFGVKRLTAIDTIEVVNVKSEMLESLMNMELIYGLLNGETGEKTNPLDACYSKLKADIVPLDKESDQFKKFCEIVKNTHGQTHRTYTLEVLEAFKVVREGEVDPSPAFEALPNHYLLWHGSRLMNFVSILSNGLKIAPPEAVMTGAMFGKGIYFADCVTKSANYCFTDYFHNTGLMMLCEVALGKIGGYYGACNVTNVPNEAFQSIKGIGLYQGAALEYIDRGFIATKLQVDANIGNITKLLYNEYIVYDPAQVKIKYLFKMKFNYTDRVIRP